MSQQSRKPRHIYLPFMSDEEIGLGDVIKRATSAVGIKPCGGCQKRAELLASVQHMCIPLFIFTLNCILEYDTKKLGMNSSLKVFEKIGYFH